jgi:adenine-specific DNA-methyltransferase
MKQNNFPKINYIGNKEKLVKWIADSIPIKSGTMLDLFAGGCSVSYEFKKRGFMVISNDILYSNFVLAKAIIENNNTLLLREDYEVEVKSSLIKNKYKNLEFLSNHLFYDYEVKELSKLVLISEKLFDYKKHLFLALLRRSIIRKIPYSRMNIKWEEITKLRDENYSYKKYKRYRHYHNISFTEHIDLNLSSYNNSIFDNKKNNQATQLDAIDAIESLKTKVDLIYIDPPYPSTMNSYNDFYGQFDIIFSKSKESKLILTKKDSFLENFVNIIKKAQYKSNYIAISLNNKFDGYINELINQLKPILNDINIYEKAHIYKITGKENKNKSYEILIVAKFIN